LSLSLRYIYGVYRYAAAEEWDVELAEERGARRRGYVASQGPESEEEMGGVAEPAVTPTRRPKKGGKAKARAAAGETGEAGPSGA